MQEDMKKIAIFALSQKCYCWRRMEWLSKIFNDTKRRAVSATAELLVLVCHLWRDDWNVTYVCEKKIKSKRHVGKRKVNIPMHTNEISNCEHRPTMWKISIVWNQLTSRNKAKRRRSTRKILFAIFVARFNVRVECLSSLFKAVKFICCFLLSTVVSTSCLVNKEMFKSLCIHQAFISMIDFVWPWTLTSWSSKLTVSCLCPRTTCASLQQNRFIRFQNIVSSLVTNGRTDGMTNGQAENVIQYGLAGAQKTDGNDKSIFCFITCILRDTCTTTNVARSFMFWSWR